MSRCLVRFLVVLVALLSQSSAAQELTWSYPYSFKFNEVEVRILNWEVNHRKGLIFVHAKLKSRAKEPVYFPWKEMLTAEKPDGESLSSNYDALVDRNGAGLTRTVGPFRLVPREKARISIPFLLDPSEFPVRLKLFDGKLSKLIKSR